MEKEENTGYKHFSFCKSVFKWLFVLACLQSVCVVKDSIEVCTKSLCHLTHYQTTNFRLVQIEKVCRRQF